MPYLTQYRLGLSVLPDNEKFQKKVSSAEAKRILSIFEDRQFSENDFSKEEQGRPFLKGRNADFNISHSGNTVAVSYINKNDVRVGCDIEKIRQRSRIEKIAEDKFSRSENNYLHSSGGFSVINFFKLWTLKECYIKLYGLSVFEMKNIPSFIKENLQENRFEFSFNINVSKPLFFRLYELSKNKEILYILAEAIEGEYLKPEIQWLSTSSVTLDCKLIEEIKAIPNMENS